MTPTTCLRRACWGIAVGTAPLPLSADADDAARAIAELRRQHDAIIVAAADGSPVAELAQPD